MAGVLDVAVQSDNFCLFFQSGNWIFCHTKSEWAAWIQAIFSIFAIFGSAWIANNLFSKEKKHQENLLKQESLVMAILVVSNLREFYFQVNKFIEKENIASKKIINIVEFKNEIFSIFEKYPLPGTDFIDKSIYIDQDLAKSLAIAHEAVRQLRGNLDFYIKNYGENAFLLDNKRIDRVFSLLDFIHDNAGFSFSKLKDFLESKKIYLEDKA